ncbi:MAG: rhombosortase [Idiomarina sp.]|nr:rhombosortase [Idiomarina sp.]
MRKLQVFGLHIPTAPRYVVPFFVVGVGLTLVFVFNLMFAEALDRALRYEYGAEPWRLVSYIFVHQDIAHLLLNLFGLLAIYVMFMEHFQRYRLLLFVPLAGLAGGLGMHWLSPQVYLMYGFSAVLYGLFAAGALGEALSAERSRRLLGVFMVIAVVLKISFDLYTAPPGLAVTAHAGGAVFGLLWALLAWALRLDHD